MKTLSQGHTQARAGRDKCIPRGGYLQAPAVSQLGPGMYICASPAPSTSLLPPWTSRSWSQSALLLRPWAGSTVEPQGAPDRVQRPLAATWHTGVLEHTAGALSARMGSPDADPARRGHQKMPKPCVARALQPDHQHVQALQSTKPFRLCFYLQGTPQAKFSTPALQTRKARLGEVGSLSKLSMQTIRDPGATQDLPQHCRRPLPQALSM